MANSKTVGIIAPGFAGDFMVDITTGIHEAAGKRGFDTFAVEGSPKVISEHELGRRHVAGWIVLLDTTDIEILAPDPVPAVIVSCPSPSPRFPVIKPDNRDSARDLAQHLVDHGYREIAFVGYLDNPDMRERCHVFQEVLRANGIEPDPRYVINVGDYSFERTEDAVRAFFALGLPCRAMIAGNDGHAMAAMDVIRSTGRRIPEDVAVAGFDDINAAQYSDPPLTTVRQPSAAMGRMAADMLIDLVEGRRPAEDLAFVPTIPIFRRSCGCQTLQESLALATAGERDGADWQTALRERVSRALRFPLALDPAEPAEALWPGLATIIAGFEAAAAGSSLPTIGALEQAWHELAARFGKPDIVMALDQAIEAAAAACRGGAGAAAVDTLLQSSKITMFRACLHVQRQDAALLSRLLWANHELGLVLVSAQARRASKLAWLERLPVQAACLAIWVDGGKGARTLEIETVYCRSGTIDLAPGQRFAAADFPPPAFFEAARADATQGSPAAAAVLVPIRSPAREWGVLVFGNSFVPRTIIDINSTHMWSMILSGAFEREGLETTLESERATLRGAYERERALADTIRELGCPLIPLLPGVLLVPLIGVIDSRRAQQIVETVLYGVGEQQAEHVLLDITGVPMVDTQVAGSLLQIASATMLLGARVALVGIRPEIAQSIVGLGIDLRMIVAYPSLAAAVQSLQRLR